MNWSNTDPSLLKLQCNKSVQVQKRWKSLLKTCLCYSPAWRKTLLFIIILRSVSRKSYLFEGNKLACFVHSSMYVPTCFHPCMVKWTASLFPPSDKGRPNIAINGSSIIMSSNKILICIYSSILLQVLFMEEITSLL